MHPHPCWHSYRKLFVVSAKPDVSMAVVLFFLHDAFSLCSLNLDIDSCVALIAALLVRAVCSRHVQPNGQSLKTQAI